MPTRARVIFRGLVAFIWDAQPGRLAAVMVNKDLGDQPKDPRRHVHLPRVSWIGHRRVGGDRRAWFKITEPFAGTLSFEWSSSLANRQVKRTPSVLDYVPSFRQLGANGPDPCDRADLDPDDPARAAPEGLDNFKDGGAFHRLLRPGEVADLESISGLVQCNAGSVDRAGQPGPAVAIATDLVSFYRSYRRPPGPATPKFPQPINFLGVPDPRDSDEERVFAQMASEVTVVFTHPDDNVDFIIKKTRNAGQPEVLAKLQPWRSRPTNNPAHPARHDLNPDDIEVVVTNFVARMDEPMPFNAHYQWFFDLHRNPPGAPNPADFEALVRKYSRETPDGAQDWGQVLQARVRDISRADDPHRPFPYIAAPTDPRGVRIMDWDDRPRCPPLRN